MQVRRKFGRLTVFVFGYDLVMIYEVLKNQFHKIVHILCYEHFRYIIRVKIRPEI